MWLRRNAVARAALGDHPIDIRTGDVTDPKILESVRPQRRPAAVQPAVRAGRHPGLPGGPAGSAVAVFGGADGLDVIRPIVLRAVTLLKPGGWLAIEHDDTHGDSVPALIEATRAFESVDLHRDLAGRPRFTTARRRA